MKDKLVIALFLALMGCMVVDPPEPTGSTEPRVYGDSIPADTLDDPRPPHP